MLAHVNSFSFRTTICTLYFHLHSIFLDAASSCTTTGTVSQHTFIWPPTLLFVLHSIFSPLVLRVTFSVRFSPAPASSLWLSSSNNAFLFRQTFFVSRCTCSTRGCIRIKTQPVPRGEGEKGAPGGDRVRPKDMCNFARHPCFKWI